MTFTGIIRNENTITVDGYSTKKTVLGAIREMGRYIAKNINKEEGEMIVKYGLESLHPANESYGGYFLEVEEVPCACQINEETDEMEYAEGNFYVACRIVVEKDVVEKDEEETKEEATEETEKSEETAEIAETEKTAEETREEKKEMSMYEGMMPEVEKEGKIGYYQVSTAEEWEELPKVYKAMEWFPVDVYNMNHRCKETTVAEYIEFDVIYMEPYKCRATVKVHVQEVQKILFCLFENAQIHLYSISGVVFANGVRWGAKWMQDGNSGAFAVYADGKCIGMQGGYQGFVPCEIERTEDGFKWAGFNGKNRCHYTLLNPFTGR